MYQIPCLSTGPQQETASALLRGAKQRVASALFPGEERAEETVQSLPAGRLCFQKPEHPVYFMAGGRIRNDRLKPHNQRSQLDIFKKFWD